MMTVWSMVGIAVVTALLALTLKGNAPTAATALSLVAGVMLLGAAISAALPLLDRVTALFTNDLLDAPFASVLLKALGIALLTQTAADVCRDAGENGLAGKVELGGQVLLLVCGLPLFEYTLDLLARVIDGQAVIP